MHDHQYIIYINIYRDTKNERGEREERERESVRESEGLQERGVREKLRVGERERET